MWCGWLRCEPPSRCAEGFRLYGGFSLIIKRVLGGTAVSYERDTILGVGFYERATSAHGERTDLQGHLARKKTPIPPGPPYDPRHRPTVES